MGEYKKYWIAVVAVLIIGFSILGYLGTDVYHQAPPVPTAYVSQDGQVLFTKEDILHGQSAWQSTGGQSVGTVLGHGAYQAPDWTADWLHKEVSIMLDIKSQEAFGVLYNQLGTAQQAAVKEVVKEEYLGSAVRDDGTVVLSPERITAMNITGRYFVELYGDNPELTLTRDHFAMKDNTLPELQDRIDMARFFFWTTWMASTQRPGTDATYTNNWPHEPLLDHNPTPESIAWSVVSVIILLCGIGVVVWLWAFGKKDDEHALVLPIEDPISKITLTPSQRSLGKYLFTILALFLFQLGMGGIIAHYTVEGQAFYGISLAQYFPYSIARTWHIQASLFWIAMAFLSAGLFLAPIINGGKDPKYQKLGVDILFWALVVLVVGSFAGTYLGVAHQIPAAWNFLLGHQGYEYIELGRIWQWIEYIGILFWLVLMIRSIIGAFKQKGDKNLIAAFIFSVIMVGIFYGPGLFYGEHSHLAIMEYWRWWVIHLWVEGFFEVFSTTLMAFIFVTLGLVSYRAGTVAAISSGAIYLIGGIPGTFHHLYFTGVTSTIVATGASFSALEVVPLVLLGYEAFENYTRLHSAPWMHRLKWPVYCFIAVSFWNLVGAGVFGFLINMPVSLFYIQGLNTTAVHAHTALFGVYGFLSLGFVFLIARYIRPEVEFNDKLMKFGFWALNIGLALMVLISLLPIGLIQAWASITHGLWFARSEEFMQQPLLQNLRWLRMIGDTILIIGAVAFFWQIVKVLFPKKS
ncbi:MAG: nitric-oxide reductase large subunit [Veillonella sp.]|uniref:nitric-oxide reductase large subunit n=1 Tax=Veillonella sp. TaxID=1926307 RepID=UPI00290431AB|nr:nitric-oxide reductase large subunit [Veillonella sp.]MDU2594885.1 nitric-oxide reductase large subunit [Veillonella sp.]MDU3275466.1 nitric-oxide reductase large subunit [Veillonella sp.]